MMNSRGRIHPLTKAPHFATPYFDAQTVQSRASKFCRMADQPVNELYGLGATSPT